MAVDGLVGVARHEQDPHRRRQRAEPLGQDAAVDLGHHHVGQQQVDAARALGADARRLVGVPHREHLVAVGLEHQPDQVADAVVVLDDHDRLGAALAVPARSPARPRPPSAAADRQVDLERRAAAGLAVDVDPAAALLDDAEHRREAEPGAGAGALGGEERLEQVLGDLLVHPVPGVADREQDVRAGDPLVAVRGDLLGVDLDVRGLDRQRAAVGHRVAGVGREVEDHALDLRPVGLDGREVGRELDPDADVVADDPVQHRLHAGDDLVEVDDLRVQDLAAAEREQLPGERGGLPGGARDLRHLLGVAVARQQDLGVAGDHRQQVVEVVRDAAGEPADRLHLLRVGEPALEPLALADVVRDDQRGAAALVVDPAGGDLDVDDRAVLAPVPPGPWPRASPGRRPRRRRRAAAGRPRRGRMSLIVIARNSSRE